jgi:hypothetical protein
MAAVCRFVLASLSLASLFPSQPSNIAQRCSPASLKVAGITPVFY